MPPASSTTSKNFARELTRRRVFGFLDFNLKGTGLINGQRLGERLERHLGSCKIEDLNRRFTAVATEIGTGHEVWLSRGSLVDAVRASYALPGVFRPVKIDGRWLFDGALVNPIPVSVCRALGARYVIAVNLNIDISSRRHDLERRPACPMATCRWRSRSPSPARTASRCAGCCSGRSSARATTRRASRPSWSTPSISCRIASRARAWRAIRRTAMISPKLHGIGLFDFHRAEDLIARGEAAAKREIDDSSASWAAAPCLAPPAHA